jgi:Ca2+-binding RTX toxin-like protein
VPIIRTGTKGADKFFAAAAAETFDGLANYDIVSYANSTAALTIDLANPSNNAGDADGDTFTSIEKFILGRGNDTFTGSSGKDTVDGFYGNDTISAGGGDDLISGHAGNDTVNGGGGADRVWGGGGDDTLTGGSDNDLVVGDKGNDILDGGAGNDILQGGTGNDTITGGLGTDTVRLLGNLADYDIVFTAGGVTVTHARGSQADGIDFIATSVETLQFANTTISRPTSGPAVTFASVSFTDTGSSTSDGVTMNASVTFAGTVSDIDGTITRVEVFNGLLSLGLATVTGGNWSLTASLADGVYDDLRVVATDDDQVTASATHAEHITVDQAAPAAPSVPDLSTASDSLPVDNDNITNIQTLDLSGTAEAGAIVRLYDATTSTLLATTVATGGVYAFTVTVPSGTYNLATTAEDLAGNVSAASGALTVIVDTQASSVVGVTVSASEISFTAADTHGPLSLVGTFAGLGSVNNGMSTTLALSAQASAKSGLLEVQDIAGNRSTVIGLGLGTSGADVLTGSSAGGGNALYGFGGDDVLTGNASGDVLYGGDGNDRLVVTAGGDTYNGDANTTAGDTLDFSNAASGVTFSLAGAATQSTGSSFGSLTWFGIENLFGGGAGDTLTGNGGANTLDGKGGNDLLAGGGGIDTFAVTAGVDTISDLGNGGADVLTVAAGATANATLSAAWSASAGSTNGGTATIYTAGFSASVASAGGPNGWTLSNASSSAAVTLTGSAFADTLMGGTGADTLAGGAGNDYLNGGVGGDILTGGNGTDWINLGVFNDNVRDYVRYGATGDFGDTVSNFDVDSIQDMVQFTGALATSLDDGRSNFSLRWSGSSSNSITVGVTVGQGNGDREALMLYGSNGEGVTAANLANATAVAAAFNAEFNITAANGEDAILVVNDTDGSDFSVWHWVQSGGGEVSAAEITLIGVYDANGTVQTSSFGFA